MSSTEFVKQRGNIKEIKNRNRKKRDGKKARNEERLTEGRKKGRRKDSGRERQRKIKKYTPTYLYIEFSIQVPFQFSTVLRLCR
jgi:hypothetical protein